LKEIKTNIVYKHLLESSKRIIVEQGGTRSGKTYNILIWLLVGYLAQNTGKIVTICRKTYPALRASAMRDFLQIAQELGMYDEKKHNKSNSEILIHGNLVEFIGMDQPQKIRGRKRNILYANEGNELFLEDWRQLSLRTSDKMIIDYNPSEEFHWIYDQVIPRDDCDFFKTTYLDNPFLEDTLVEEIERLKEVDDNYWQVYGLGERGRSKALIFNHDQIDTIPSDAKFKAYGLDFGYSNDPTALVSIWEKDRYLYIDELIYKTGMTNQDISNELKSLGIDKRDIIWADSSEPKSIEEIHRMGFNIRPVTKGRDSIDVGIDIMRRFKLTITSRSVNLIKEFRNYKYIEDKNGKVTNKPLDAFNHGVDASRYAAMMTFSRPNVGKYSIR
jgi:phage terminase large subunit